MRCFGRTTRVTRCKLDARWWGTCNLHRWQLLTGTGAVLVALASIAAILSWAGVPAPWVDDEPTADNCVELRDPNTVKEVVVAELLCSVAFANIWEPDRPVDVQWQNADLLLEEFERYGPGGREDDSFSPTARDEPSGESDLSRLFERWPAYRNQASISVGRVRSFNQYTSDVLGSVWVVQLGTQTDRSQIVYLRLERPQEWSPPTVEDCPTAVFEGLPLARGFVIGADSPNLHDVIYAQSSVFICGSANPTSADD